MMPPHCSEFSLDEVQRRWPCVLEAGHEDDHMDIKGRTWEPVGVVLARFRENWGRTHRVAYLPSGMWLATARNKAAAWRSEAEPTPALLEASLERHLRDPANRRSLDVHPRRARSHRYPRVP